MTPRRFRLRQLGYDLASGLLFRPAMFIASLTALAVALPLVETRVAPAASAWLATEPASAQVLLGTLAGSMMTVVSVVYSILLVALSLASIQFSTRVLAGMMRSRVSQNTLGLFGGTFVYCMVLLRSVHVDPTPAVPGVALTLALVLALASLGGLVYFIHHIVQGIQANHLVDRIALETEGVIDAVFPPSDRPSDAPSPSPEPAPPPVPDDAVPVRAARSGYIQLVDLAGLQAQIPAGGRLWIARPMGAFVSRGLPLAYASGWQPDEHTVRAAFDIGPVRTMQEDVEFGFRQIVDIALKAISPAVNDPSTAATCIDHLGRLLIRLAGRRAPPAVLGGLIVPRTAPGELADLAFEQLRQYGRTDMAVALRLLRTLADVASVTRDRAMLDRLALHARLIEAAARSGFAPEDCDELERRSALVRRYTRVDA